MTTYFASFIATKNWFIYLGEAWVAPIAALWAGAVAETPVAAVAGPPPKIIWELIFSCHHGLKGFVKFVNSQIMLLFVFFNTCSTGKGKSMLVYIIKKMKC